MMMLSHPSTPQHRKVEGQSSLWPSPQFSDYFSGSEDPQSPHNADQRKNPVQARIVLRLSEIAKKVSTQGHVGHETPNLLDFDTELSALEARLNAPESQTRSIAEDANSGLFSDDEDEDEDLRIENEELRRELQEGKEVVERISKVMDSLKQRYEDMKKTNHDATEELEKAHERLLDIEDENSALRAHNDRLHADLHTAIPTIFRLKSQMLALELQTSPDLDTTTRDDMQQMMKQWNRVWEDVHRDFEDIERRFKPPKSSLSTSKATGNGMSSSSHETRSASPATGHRSRIILRRGGLIRRLEVDPANRGIPEDDKGTVDDDDVPGTEQCSGTEESEIKEDSELMNGVEQGGQDEKTTGLASGDGADENKDDAIRTDEDFEYVDAPLAKTPWQEFWDSLAEYVGIRDYEDFR